MFRRVISKYLNPAERTDFLSYLQSRCDQVMVMSVVAVSPDPDDDFLLSLSKDGQAHYLITDDKRDLLTLREFDGTQIVTLTEFLALPG